ncbi:MAG: hypothetical protein ABI621_13775 [Chloroflexota bacterium]
MCSSRRCRSWPRFIGFENYIRFFKDTSAGASLFGSLSYFLLTVPLEMIVALAYWGKNPVFDRAWTILSILIMGALAMLFAFDMWVA